ncbi:MAG TPA: sigma-54 dependent transcriptional regulator [Burkholderiales bacterium]
MPSLLLIEDEDTLAKNVQRYLARQGWDVELAGTAESGLAQLAKLQPDVVVLDFQLPGMDGRAALATIRERDPDARVVMVTGQSSVQLAVDAMKAGAADFLPKPLVLADLKRVLDKLAGEGRMRKALAYYHARDQGCMSQILGESPAMIELKERIRLVLRAEAGDTGGPAPAILITGETGSGKEMIARACHSESRRKDGPFIEINCAAIPANLLEAELFGYEKGAFTGANERKIGLIEAADGGTLFLDEIGEADASTQAKLLKVIEEQRIRRVGSVQERRVDVRMIAATNQLLEERAREGKFRPDLLYRLRVIELKVPPLRARGEDILLLANRFLGEFAKRYGKPGLAFTPAALDRLTRHDWPGNVRELRNLIEQAVLLARGATIDYSDLGLPAVETCSAAAAPEPEAPQVTLELAQVERDLLRQALERTAWNVTQAARILGITRDTLRSRIEKHGLARPAEPSAPVVNA